MATPGQAPKTRRVKRGDPIRARDNVSLRDWLRLLQGIQNTLNISRPRRWAESMRHQITAINDDYLECVRVWRPDGGGGFDVGTEVVYVARPERLRASETARAGVTFTYVDAQTRTATSGPDTETQRVTPTYLVGDIIEVQMERTATGISIVDEQRGVPVDKNVDGRAWAAEPAP